MEKSLATLIPAILAFLVTRATIYRINGLSALKWCPRSITSLTWAPISTKNRNTLPSASVQLIRLTRSAYLTTTINLTILCPSWTRTTWAIRSRGQTLMSRTGTSGVKSVELDLTMALRCRVMMKRRSHQETMVSTMHHRSQPRERRRPLSQRPGLTSTRLTLSWTLLWLWFNSSSMRSKWLQIWSSIPSRC